MPWELWRDPMYAMSSPYWGRKVEAEYNILLHNFFSTSDDMELPLGTLC